MSSLRNAVKRITHKERSQPISRQHLGLLEKKKDYKIRSKDYHQKQDAIKKLRQKASERNPDEFYFGMNNSGVHKGRHVKLAIAKEKERMGEIGMDVVKVMKTQDLSYVRNEILKDGRKVERLQASLHYLGDNPEVEDDDDYNDSDDDEYNNGDGKSKKGRRKHTVFVDNNDQARNFDIAEHFDTLPELAGRSFNRPRKETLLKMNSNRTEGEIQYDENGEEYKPNTSKSKSKTELQLRKQRKNEQKQAKKISKARAAAYTEMEARKKRMIQLKNAEAHLVAEKIVASKGRKRKIRGEEGGKPAIYKFRRKRAS
jgi:U3 small nucleolar RNA-associated protein 11